jgi:transposase InsO family protein
MSPFLSPLCSCHTLVDLEGYSPGSGHRVNGTETVFIDHGSPWQNAWVESFNGRLRDEHLNGQRFDSLLEAKVFTKDWRIDCNINRPHGAHGWLTPATLGGHRTSHAIATDRWVVA